MTTSAGGRLVAALRGGKASAFSMELQSSTDKLSLAVEGFGPVAFPVTAANARKLASLAQPARFGRGEQTLTDRDVRDTWEIPKHLVRATWDAATWQVVLATVHDKLGLPPTAELTADLHSFLVYEPGQFFVTHQDTEKDDSMIGTLVVTLPSRHTGGELVVGLGNEQRAYHAVTPALSVVAFYADCRHEVRKVRSGCRITLTYNLLLHGDTSHPRQEGDDANVAELTELLHEHFCTPVRKYHDGPAITLSRLVYVLDHEYTPRALGWRRLKGADAHIAARLRAAADSAGCEAILALADVKTTHSATGPEADYRHRDWDDDAVEYEGHEQEFDIEELIESSTTLTHWTRPDGRGLKKISLPVRAAEVYEYVATDTLAPYSSKYEGYMGNFGNTLDRWYHRAAIVVWPRDKSFANRAEATPAWALDELATMPATEARTAASVLWPFWSTLIAEKNSDEVGTLFGRALLAAQAVADPDTAKRLLRPFGIESVTDEHVGPLGSLVSGYGEQWSADLFLTLFGQRRGGQVRTQWVADRLPGVCQGLLTAGRDGEAAAHRLLDAAWKSTAKEIAEGLTVSTPSHRNSRLNELGNPLSSLLRAASAINAATIRDTVCGFIRDQQPAVVVLELAALRAAAQGDAGFADLAADCAARLRARLARPRRADGDWSIALPPGCTCDLCGKLRAFLADKSRRAMDWKLAKERRQHVHSRIDGAELSVTHVTRRQGSPYTLVLNKTDALFSREHEARARYEKYLNWIATGWPGG